MTKLTERFYLIMIAGLAGGLAEIFWISLYSAVTHTGGLEISRQITATLIPGWVNLSIAPALGVTIHLLLSVLLAFLCCTILIDPLSRRIGHAWILPASMVILVCVWAINFFIVLPVINPAFITLLPFLVTLASKMLFGWTMGTVLTKGIAAANRSVN